MPKFLIVSATKFEIQPLIDRFKINVKGEEGLFSSETLPDVSVLITGVGMVNTAFYLGKYSDNKFNYIINAGVCGAINRDLKLGEIVNIVSDTLSELGAEDDEKFIKYPDLNLGGTNMYENPSAINHPGFNLLKKVYGITVNKVHGNEVSIKKMKQLYMADVESMEGAAFLRGCKDLTTNYFQLRAVSNYVEKRDKSKWEMKLAIKNLNDFLIKLVEDLDKSN
ncbi:MAG: futalosine hydrolase [Bacteroidia bacterium]